MLKKLLDLLLVSLVRVISLVVIYTPKAIGFCICKFIIKILIIAMPRLSKVAYRNTEIIFPAKTSLERKLIIKNSYSVLANNLYTFFLLPKLNKNNITNLFSETYSSNLKNIKKAEELASEANTGIIFATLHYGCFEYLIQAQTFLRKPIAALARGFGLTRFDNWWKKRRELYGNEIFSRGGGYNELIKRINNGQDVAVLYDQNVRGSHAIFVNFFSQKAATTKTLALAAIRTEAPILFATCAWLGDDKYQIISKNINTHKDCLDKKLRIERISREVNQAAEEAISLYPEQWFWIHRRFKTRPAGEPENTY